MTSNNQDIVSILSHILSKMTPTQTFILLLFTATLYFATQVYMKYKDWELEKLKQESRK